ncbi:MAG: hypothetical protein LQ340_005603, partial [Diploschistes diacapsis]
YWTTVIDKLNSPSSSRTAIHKTGIQILALDISPYHSHAVLAGGEILKTVRVEDADCTEDFNLRSKIIAYASTHSSSRDALSAQHRDQLSAYDVKWSHGKFDTTIATAAANGRIVIYDLNAPSVEIARLHEHTRQVHRVAFNPHQGALLLSGSQDATIRMWDLRALGDKRSVRTCGSINKFPGNNEGVRDLKWSPSDGVEFAVGTDNGTVQRWDFRKENAPLVKLNAHDRICCSIDWHPSGSFLASGGADKAVKIWNFKSPDRRMKPSALLRTPQTVRRLRWSPGAASVDGDGLKHYDSSFLATSYDAKDPRIHIWDLRRPHIPSQELDRYDTPATDMLWHTENLLWSVGSAGAFTQTDLNFAPRPIERHNTNVLALAPDGTICAFFNEKPQRRVLFETAHDDSARQQNTSGSNDEKFSSSQSANEESLEEPNIIHSALRKRREKLHNSRLTASTVAESTDASVDIQEKVSNPFLETYKSEQSAFVGHVRGLFDPDGFSYLARNYKLPSRKTLDDGDHSPHETLKWVFESNASLAEDVGLYRLAQSWRILGHAVNRELMRRARDSKLSRNSINLEAKQLVSTGQSEPQGKITNGHVAGKNPAYLPHVDNHSNVSTPLARPVTDQPPLPVGPDDSDGIKASDTLRFLGGGWNAKGSFQTRTKTVASSDQSALSPNLSDSQGVPSKSRSLKQQREAEPSLIGPKPSTSVKEFSDMEAEMQARRIAISNYRAKPRTILNLDSPFDISRTLPIAPHLERHDSDESFQMFSASVESDRRSFAMPGSFEELQRLVPPGSSEELGRSIPQSSMSQHTSLVGSHSRGLMSELDQPLSARAEAKPWPLKGRSSQRFPPINRPVGLPKPRMHLQGALPATESKAKPLPPEFQASDFFSPPEKAQADLPPWNIYCLLPPLINFHLEKLADSQTPSFLALHLSTLFPSLFPEPQTLSYLSCYYQQLLSLQLYGSAAELRNACERSSPPIASKFSGPGVADWYCRNCRKPVGGEVQGICRRCQQQWGACPICEDMDGSTYADSKNVKTQHARVQIDSARLWTWCQGCGHGGHSPCLASWFADTKVCEGTCPVAGCGHDCVEGPQREATVVRIEMDKSKGKKNVVRDEWAVGESKAVERARGIVGSEVQSRRSGKILAATAD